MYKYHVSISHYQKKAGTKTVWGLIDTTEDEITQEQHKNATSDDTIRFFSRLGGSETVTRGYTAAGYIVTKIVSISPNRQEKTVRDYTINYNEELL